MLCNLCVVCVSSVVFLPSVPLLKFGAHFCVGVCCLFLSYNRPNNIWWRIQNTGLFSIQFDFLATHTTECLLTGVLNCFSKYEKHGAVSL